MQINYVCNMPEGHVITTVLHPVIKVILVEQWVISKEDSRPNYIVKRCVDVEAVHVSTLGQVKKKIYEKSKKVSK